MRWEAEDGPVELDSIRIFHLPPSAAFEEGISATPLNDGHWYASEGRNSDRSLGVGNLTQTSDTAALDIEFEGPGLLEMEFSLPS